MTQLIIVEPTGNEQRVTLSRDEYILGRDPTVSIPLRDRKVSRQHARIFRKGASYLIEDLGSVNGVLADGAAIQGAKKLVPGIEFDVGGFLLSVLPENLDAELTFTFTGRTPPFSGQEFLLPQGELEVGRVDGNAIVIPDTSVSRQHAAVLVGSSVVEVRDNGSSNGTFVNGERIVNRTLAGGDVVAFGNVEFDFSVSGDEAGAFPQLSALLGGKTAGQLAVVLAGATVVVLVGVLLYLLWPSGSDDQVLVSEQELRFERNLDSTLKRAEETFERAEWSEARTLFDEVLRDDPIHVRAREGRQRAAENQKHKLSLDAARRAFSEKLYRKAITHAREIPSNSHYAEQGVALTSDAQRQLARIVAKAVETECSAGEWQKCYAATVEHMRLIPESSDYSAQMTRAASELKKAGVEVEIFTKPSTTDDLSIFKMYQAPLLRRAVVKLSEGKTEEAIAVCRNAVTQAPESAQARQVLRILSDLQMERHAADTATQSLNIRSAIEHWRHALNLHDQLVPASSVSVVRNKIRLAIGNQLFSLGQTAFSRNMFAESFQYWDQGVRVNPTNPNLKKGLKRLEDQAKLTLSSVDEGTPEACVPLRQVLLTTARSSPVHKRAFAKLANSNCPG